MSGRVPDLVMVKTPVPTEDDLRHGELVVWELHGLKSFEAWAERIAKAIAIARAEERGTIEAERRDAVDITISSRSEQP